MAFNLFVAYDLIPPGQKYTEIQNRIKQLGPWYKLQYSLYYVQSSLGQEAAHHLIREVMDPNDALAVIDAKDAFISPLPLGDLQALQSQFVLGQTYVPA